MMIKNIIKSLVVLFIWIMCVAAMRAQNQHWQCSPYDWQYDMAMYFTLSINNAYINDFTNYEIAAFCGEECRGVATIKTIDKDGLTASYGYIRIRSNQTTGEKITFKVYDYTNNREIVLDYTIDFFANSLKGLPSKPIVMRQFSYLRGDSNSDGEIGMPDVMFIINYILGTPESSFNADAADANMDGEVGMPDVMFIVNYILNGKFPDE